MSSIIMPVGMRQNLKYTFTICIMGILNANLSMVEILAYTTLVSLRVCLHIISIILQIKIN